MDLVFYIKRSETAVSNKLNEDEGSLIRVSLIKISRRWIDYFGITCIVMFTVMTNIVKYDFLYYAGNMVLRVNAV